MDRYLKNLGNRIAELREKKGLSRIELGKASETTYVTIGSIEEGETATNVHLLRKIAKSLDTSAGELLLYAEDPSSAANMSLIVFLEKVERMMMMIRHDLQDNRHRLDRNMEQVLDYLRAAVAASKESKR